MMFYIVTISVAILGFVILLAYLFTLDPRSQEEDVLCKLSVLTRATSPDLAQSYIPLRCSTKKICLSDNFFGSDCKEFAGEKNVISIRLSGTEEDFARTIEKTYTEAMYGCWDSMGQGKLSLFTKGASEVLGLATTQATCVICSRIAIDINEPEKKQRVLNKVNINEYMRRTQIPGQQFTFLQAFTDRSVNSFTPINNDVLNSVSEIEKDSKVEFGQTDEMAIVFSQIKPRSYTDTLNNLGTAGATVAGTAFFTPGIGRIATRAIFTLPGLAISAAAAAGVTAYSMSTVYEGRVAAAGYCGKFTTADSAMDEGCSVTQIVPYDFKSLNQICYALEGNF